MLVDNWIAKTDVGELNPHFRVPARRGAGFQAIASFARALDSPVIVETGCMRQKDDWAGAGCSTLILAALAQERGGIFSSVDISQRNLDIATAELKVAGLRQAQLVQGDSVELLSRWVGEIDILYLDSLDTTQAEYAEHGLKEASTAPMSENSLIAFDDSPRVDGTFVGKGELGIPYLLSAGWTIISEGYQVVLTR